MRLLEHWSSVRPELRLRVQTAAVGVAALLFLTLGLGVWGTALVAVVLALLMMNEFLGMVLTLDDRQEKSQVFFGVIWLVHFFSFFVPRMEYELLLVSFLGLFAYFLLTAGRHAQSSASLEAHLREFVYGFFGLVYLGLLPLFLPLIRGLPDGRSWLFLFFLLNWVGDSAAYFVGLKKGKRKLYLEISPKKTWEGAWGGMLGGMLVTLIYKGIVFREMSWLFTLMGPVIVGTFAQLGDLCESFIKRAFERKDSGQLLPGHGGVLDRFDGLVVSAPVMYFCIRAIG
ncbi:MAG: hypothetical protein RJB38_121 [Pseudomonadota bacterium]|jgi:phosphatidate cytidylyltransferase